MRGESGGRATVRNSCVDGLLRSPRSRSARTNEGDVRHLLQRTLVAFGLALVLATSGVTPVALANHDAYFGSNWGHFCDDTPLSQCVANDASHHYTLDAGLSSSRANATARGFIAYGGNSDINGSTTHESTCITDEVEGISPRRALAGVPRVSIPPLVLAVVLSACYGPGALPVDPSTGLGPIASNDLIVYPPDNMWAFLASKPGLQPGFDDLAGAVAGSDTVLIGRYIGLERGPAYAVPGATPGWHAIARIQVDTILKGTPAVAADGTVHVQFVLVVGGAAYPDATFANLKQSIPNGPALLFLETWATYFARAGADVPKGFEGLDSREIYRTVGGDGAIRIEQGLLSPPEYVDGWPLDLKGVSINAVETQVRSLATTGTP